MHLSLWVNFPFSLKMKIPEHWLALLRRALFVSILARNTSHLWFHVTPEYVTWCHISCQHESTWVTSFKTHKVSHFSTWRLWPMTLTIKGDLDNIIIQIHPCAKCLLCMSSGSIVRVLNDRQPRTHRQNWFYTPDRWPAGGKKKKRFGCEDKGVKIGNYIYPEISLSILTLITL